MYVSSEASQHLCKCCRHAETEQNVAALFALAERHSPTIIFIGNYRAWFSGESAPEFELPATPSTYSSSWSADEVDGLLEARGSREELTSLKTKFMLRWDGLLTDQGVRRS